MRVFHFLKAEHALAALHKGRIKVACIGELNDPFELLCSDMRDPRHRRGFQRFKAQCAQTFGYLCFTRTWKNLMLWSMYADKHQGAALEVELPDDVAMPVKYRKTRVIWDVEKIMQSGGFSRGHVDIISTTKSNHWKYETEIRAAALLADAEREGDLYFSTVDIRGIVLGALSKISEEQIRDALPAGKSVKVTRARLAFGSYNVVRRKDIPRMTVRGCAR